MGQEKLPFLLCLPTVHTVHGWPSKHRSLALVMGCCQQMTEYMVCVLPLRPPACMGLVAGGSSC